MRRELIPNELSVELCEHILELAGVHRQCWTAVTQGMADVGQPEMVFTIAGGKGAEDFPASVLDYLRWVRGMAAEGQILKSGDASGGPFGLGSLAGVLFSPATPDHDVVLPANAVQGVLIRTAS